MFMSKTKESFMLHNFLSNANFHSFLVSLDQEIAKETQQKGCSCGGKLHQANYPRSPSGLLQEHRSEYEQRLSFCCDDCRKRMTPASVRFFGRRWFVAPVLVFISVLTLGINHYRLEQVKRHFGITVSERTWKRWRRWWRETFIQTRFWQRSKGLVATFLPEETVLPRALWFAFQGQTQGDRLGRLLQFLMPLTTHSLHSL